MVSLSLQARHEATAPGLERLALGSSHSATEGQVREGVVASTGCRAKGPGQPGTWGTETPGAGHLITFKTNGPGGMGWKLRWYYLLLRDVSQKGGQWDEAYPALGR